MSNPLYASVLPVLRNLPSNHPRQPLLPGLKRRPLSLWPLLFLIIAACALPFLLFQLFQSAKIDASRIETKGRVTQVEVVKPSDSGGQTAFVKYRFMAGQNLLYGNALIAPQEAPSIGDTLAISYDPKRTSDNYRVQSAPFFGMSGIERMLLSLLGTAIIVGLFSFITFQNTRVSPRDLLELRRARSLYRNGELTAGRVQFVRSSKAGSAFEIVATYKVEGVRHLAVARCDNSWLVNQLSPETEVVVAHDPLKPERAVILEPFAF